MSPCKDGWMGTNCQEKCPKGTYGKGCGKNCKSCENCDHVTGLCPNEKSPTECPKGTFGKECSRKCYCKDAVPCDSMTGRCPDSCRSGYTGISCEINTTTLPLLVGVWVGVAIMLLGIIPLIVFFVIRRIRRELKDSDVDMYSSQAASRPGTSCLGPPEYPSLDFRSPSFSNFSTTTYTVEHPRRVTITQSLYPPNVEDMRSLCKDSRSSKRNNQTGNYRHSVRRYENNKDSMDDQGSSAVDSPYEHYKRRCSPRHNDRRDHLSAHGTQSSKPKEQATTSSIKETSNTQMTDVNGTLSTDTNVNQVSPTPRKDDVYTAAKKVYDINVDRLPTSDVVTYVPQVPPTSGSEMNTLS